MKKFLLPILFFVSVLCVGCHRQATVVASSVEYIAIDSTLDPLADTHYQHFIDSLNGIMNQELGRTIGYCPRDAVVRKPECELLNWATDAILNAARKVSKKDVDIAIMNTGGLRCKWKKGRLTIRDVFMLMPFNNELCIISLKGQDILELCQIICMVGGQGVANMQIRGENGQLISATIGGKEIEPEKTYLVATSDYLMSGKDDLLPLARHTAVYPTHTTIRNVLIETVEEQKTINLRIDGRMLLKTI